MQRFGKWELSLAPDFWRNYFQPKDLIRVIAHANSVLSMRYDARLMERYDINDIDEHTPGYTKIWEEVRFGEPKYLGSDEVYPYEYDIDEGWLYVDAIYESHVDPQYTFQHDIDFELDTDNHKIRFVEELPDMPLYISKGQYAGYRIYNEIGMLLDYKRLDSLAYRDSIAPILAAFYLGPTPNNLLAVMNVVVGMPVAKYGNETVITIGDNVVVTDKYTYDMKGAEVTVHEGDVLYQFQPLSNAVQIMTHKTDPYWWTHRNIELFEKYCIDEPMSEELRDYIMGTFLYDAVAYVLFNLQWQDLQNFTMNQDILQLFYDALPTRTDIFLGQQYVTGDFDTWDGEIMSPDDDTNILVRPGIFSMWGLVDIPGDMWYYSPDMGRPIWTDDLTDPLALTLNDYRWHIFSNEETDNWREFWSTDPRQTSYVEPNFERIYFRFSTVAPWEHLELREIDLTGMPEIGDNGVQLSMKGESTGGIYSELDVDLEDMSVIYSLVQGETVCGTTEMNSWELDNLIMSKDGLEVYDEGTGTAESPGFPLGGIPKDLFVRAEYDEPEGTSVKAEYSWDRTVWTEFDFDDIFRNVTGTIYFRITLTATTKQTPTFKRMYVNLSV